MFIDLDRHIYPPLGLDLDRMWLAIVNGGIPFSQSHPITDVIALCPCFRPACSENMQSQYTIPWQHQLVYADDR